jgi:hypothetical protein
MGVSGQRHTLAALYPRETTLGTQWIGGWVGLRAGLDTEVWEPLELQDHTTAEPEDRTQSVAEISVPCVCCSVFITASFTSCIVQIISILFGLAMAQAVSFRPLTAEARLSPCGICGGKSFTVTGFSSSSSVFSCQYHHSIIVLHADVSPGG